MSSSADVLFAGRLSAGEAARLRQVHGGVHRADVTSTTGTGESETVGGRSTGQGVSSVGRRGAQTVAEQED
jgi:hypothetical protein